MGQAITPVIDTDFERTKEQLALAAALRKQGMEGNGGAGYHGGRIFAVGNRLGDVAQMIGGQMLGDRAREQQVGLEQRQQQERQNFLNQMPSETETVPQFGPGQNGEVLPDVTREKDPRALQQAMTAWAAQAPRGMEGVQQFALQQAMMVPEKRAATEEARKQRVFEMAQKAQDARALQQERLDAQSQLQLTLKQMGTDSAKTIASIAAAARAGNNNPPVNQDAADFIAARFLEGDQNALVGISRNKDLHAAVVGSIARQAKEQNIDPKEAVQRGLEFGSEKAAQRKIGERGATVEMAATEANNMIPIVTDLSKKIPRAEFPTINAAGNIIKKQSGDPNVVAFDQSIDTLINGYARAISPTGVPTVADKKRAHEKLNAAFSQGQLDSVVGVMQQEMDAALRSPSQASAARREARVGKPEGSPTGSQPTNATVVRTGKDANGRKVEQLSDGTVRYAQ